MAKGWFTQVGKYPDGTPRIAFQWSNGARGTQKTLVCGPEKVSIAQRIYEHESTTWQEVYDFILLGKLPELIEEKEFRVQNAETTAEEEKEDLGYKMRLLIAIKMLCG